MTTGDTTVGSVSDALNTMVAKARVVRDYDAVVPRTVDRQRLSDGTGTNWIEDRLELLVAQDIDEQTILDNPKQYDDTKLSISTAQSGISTYVSNRTMRRIDPKVAALMRGEAMGRAMQRKKDTDLILNFATFTTTYAGTGQTLHHGFISAAANVIKGNTTEPYQGGVINAVLHPYAEKDLEDEIVAGVGTMPVPDGMSADAYRKGFSGMIAGVNVYTDGNIAINSTPDARGAVYAKDAIILVETHGLEKFERFNPAKGGGGTEYYLYEDYGSGIRRDVWGGSVLHDATAPAN